MPILTPDDFIKQMVQQLRTLDPNISASPGTPEYKIIATVASALSATQIDANVVNGSMDLMTKYGSNLDSFMQVFGFGRQSGVAASASVTLSRSSTSALAIVIPAGTQVASSDGLRVVYNTTASVAIEVGVSEVLAPVRASVVGEIGNKPAGVITDFVGSPVLGVSSVVNSSPATGGINVEGDDEYKSRFKNTIFRNLSGTEDQYLATAVSMNSTKATVLGPISKHLESFQVPSVDDGSKDEDGRSGKGNYGEYTTSLSSVTYSKYTYPDSFYVTNPDRSFFYSPNSDYIVNANVVPALKYRGDTRRMGDAGTGPDLIAEPPATYFYQPNLTFISVTNDELSSTVSPKDTVFVEHSYISTASRNDWDRGILNCVDIFLNNHKDSLADAVVAKPYDQIFNTLSGNRFNISKFIRSGQIDVHPRAGNLYSVLLWQPVSYLPSSIVIGLETYYLDTHYWLVKSLDLEGTVRSRDGIEWAANVKGELASDTDGIFTGRTLLENTEAHITINKYMFDENVVSIQSAIEKVRPVTTDVLVHKAKSRYFKFDVTIMYNSGVNIASVDSAISAQLSDVMSDKYFGTTIQLSDVLQAIHNVGGVDNVRWTYEDGTGPRITECNADGSPVMGVSAEAQGNKAYVVLTGSPEGGEFNISFDAGTTAWLPYDIKRNALQNAVRNIYFTATVSGSGTPTDPFVITLPAEASVSGESSPYNPLYGGPYVFDADLGLRDDELPAIPQAFEGDTVAGLIITKRVQSNWNK